MIGCRARITIWSGVERAIQDSVADYVAVCRATSHKPFLDGRHFELWRAVAATVAAILT